MLKSRYTFLEKIDLYTEHQIKKEDAKRQKETAIEILNRIRDRQPGLILADEVGMGKTFVALSVAVSSHMSDPDRRPIVIMVPPSLMSKWESDFEEFKGCIKDEAISRSLQCAKAFTAEDFLKLFDDPIERRKTVVLLKYGATASGLSDPWVKVALIKRAIKGRKNISDLYTSLSRYMASIIDLKMKSNRLGDDSEEFWIRILNSSPSEWVKIINRYEFNKEPIKDDPVPKAIEKALEKLPTEEVNNLFAELYASMPRRDGSNLEERIKKSKKAINDELKKIWRQLVLNLDITSSLLILDEAHHVKNAHTNLAKAFATSDAEKDSEAIHKGALANVFDRILFLTATPFQLSHYELISILERFRAINWDTLSSYKKSDYEMDIKNLHNLLDKSQQQAVQLERYWGDLEENDIKELPEKWWELDISDIENPRISRCKLAFQRTHESVVEAQGELKKWVIRHLRDRHIIYNDKTIARRKVIEGSGIKDDISSSEGLGVTKEELFPFLLAARAISVSSENRPVFAEGLASSYEAFLDTRKSNLQSQDEEDLEIQTTTEQLTGFYLDQIEKSLERKEGFVKYRHPKLSETVDKAISLWKKGEKVLIFCHYYQTGRTLRHNISIKINQLILEASAQKLNCSIDETKEHLVSLGQAIDRQKAQIDEYVVKLIKSQSHYAVLEPMHERIGKIIKRMIRTPNFLSRFYPMEEYATKSSSSSKLLEKSFKQKDASGMTVEQLILNFFDFLSRKSKNIEKYLFALEKIKTGSIFQADEIEDDLDEAEKNPNAKDESNSTVRLANGSVSLNARNQLMLAFNTPFIPDILIASSVMAEGVDLHLNCRFIIHHDLAWNPSTLEQRTGRIDRIGAKVENCGESIYSYLPYLSATQDEKMFKVVMDRERWFKVVMGDTVKINSAFDAEKLANRVNFPEEAAEKLMFKLQVVE
ncbi:MAG: DEAD/DEAH box helicase [Oligoflexia bacterium]|nr:DEAD/DEAH box helicase [Oligoflexia bacterium]